MHARARACAYVSRLCAYPRMHVWEVCGCMGCMKAWVCGCMGACVRACVRARCDLLLERVCHPLLNCRHLETCMLHVGRCNTLYAALQHAHAVGMHHGGTRIQNGMPHAAARKDTQHTAYLLMSYPICSSARQAQAVCRNASLLRPCIDIYLSICTSTCYVSTTCR